MRIAMGIEYNGRAFHGWQVQQPGMRTVQGSLEEAIAVVANHPVRVHCAGRTDIGVHGVGQVIHFDTESVRTARQWTLGCNTNAPDDLNVRWVKEVDENFHARFKATGRTYRYLILNRLTRSSLLAGKVTWIYSPLDVEQMQEASKSLIGRHDFSSYRATHCQAKHPVREIRSLELRRHGNFVEMLVSADGFLHHMVRNIAGVLIAIGKGDKPPSWAGKVLDLRDRDQGGITAPAAGLYFERVEYPAEFEIPDSSPDYVFLG